MNYEASTHLSDEKFKRLIGAGRIVFNEMLAYLGQAQATVHQKGGRKLKIGFAKFKTLTHLGILSTMAMPFPILSMK